MNYPQKRGLEYHPRQSMQSLTGRQGRWQRRKQDQQHPRERPPGQEDQHQTTRKQRASKLQMQHEREAAQAAGCEKAQKWHQGANAQPPTGSMQGEKKTKPTRDVRKWAKGALQGEMAREVAKHWRTLSCLPKTGGNESLGSRGETTGCNPDPNEGNRLSTQKDACKKRRSKKQPIKRGWE